MKNSKTDDIYTKHLRMKVKRTYIPKLMYHLPYGKHG